MLELVRRFGNEKRMDDPVILILMERREVKVDIIAPVGRAWKDDDRELEPTQHHQKISVLLNIRLRSGRT